MEGSASVTMESLSTVLGYVGTFLTEALTWIGEVATYVANNPLLFVMVFGIPLAGIGISYLKRLLAL